MISVVGRFGRGRSRGAHAGTRSQVRSSSSRFPFPCFGAHALVTLDRVCRRFSFDRTTAVGRSDRVVVLTPESLPCCVHFSPGGRHRPSRSRSRVPVTVSTLSSSALSRFSSYLSVLHAEGCVRATARRSVSVVEIDALGGRCRSGPSQRLRSAWPLPRVGCLRLSRGPASSCRRSRVRSVGDAPRSCTRDCGSRRRVRFGSGDVRDR